MSTKESPIIETKRLKLRPFTLDDAPEVQRLAGDKDIASTTGSIPHPYEDGVAEQWIGTHQEKFERGESIIFAITHHEQGFLIGTISLTINKEHERGSLDYWIGKPYWNNGYCTEAAQTVMKFGFEVMGLNKVFAVYVARNPASGRVMQKIGMIYEGCLRQQYKKWGKFEDMVWYGILKSEYNDSSHLDDRS